MLLPFSGCSNFLSVYPLNDIVEENFWTSMDDVESVLMAAYAKLESSDCINRMAFWGEMRSDNLVEGSGSVPEDIKRVLTKDNLLQSNTYVTWSCFYDVINLANTVIAYAPVVCEKDPNYRVEQMQSHIAEAKAIRALSYFYLIRTFKDVPYVTEPTKDDTKDPKIPATSFEEILHSEIASLQETVQVEGKEWANRKFATDEAQAGRITRAGVYALLADMCLWDQDYVNCIEYASRVTKLKNQQYSEIKEKLRSACDIELYNGYPLIRAAREAGTDNVGNSYNKIFGDGFSYESIFELAFIRDQSVKNSFITDYYGASDRPTSLGYLAANNSMHEDGNSTTATFAGWQDTRYHESMYYIASSSKYRINKYVNLGVSYSLKANNPVLEFTRRVDAVSPNWIIYRYTDVLLLQAEAEACFAKQENLGKNSQEFSDVISIVNAVRKRAVVKNVDTISTSTVETAEDLIEAVMLERRRELAFEGKRWYDLVRRCRRDGSTEYVINKVMSKYTENRDAIRIKLHDMDALYFPISKDELKINPNLTQNPVYKENEDISKSK